MSFTIRMDNGDLDSTADGEQVRITGPEKAAQDLLEEVLLPYDVARDRGNEMLGSDGAMIPLVSDDGVGQHALRSMLEAAVYRLMRAQGDDTQLDPGELIQKLVDVSVVANPDDVTSYAFMITVQVSGENIAIARAIRMGHLGNTPTPLLGGYDLTA